MASTVVTAKPADDVNVRLSVDVSADANADAGGAAAASASPVAPAEISAETADAESWIKKTSGPARVDEPSTKRVVATPVQSSEAKASPSAEPSATQVKPGGSIADAWAGLLVMAQGKPSWRWMKALTLANSDDMLAVFTPGAVNSEQVRFLLSQRSKLVDELSRLTGRSVRVEIQISTRQAESAAATEQANQPLGIQVAMTLPLVRKIMDQFNATVLDVRREEPVGVVRPVVGGDSETSAVVDPAGLSDPADDGLISEPDIDSDEL